MLSRGETDTLSVLLSPRVPSAVAATLLVLPPFCGDHNRFLLLLLQLLPELVVANATLEVSVHTVTMSAALKHQLRPVLLLGLLLLLSSVFATAAAGETSKSATAEKKVQQAASPAATAEAPAAAAGAGDLDVCKKKLTYAEQRAENAENDLLSFRQKHEESLAACTSKLEKQQQQQSCKEQTEALLKRLNEETKSKAEVETKLQQQMRQQEQDAAVAGDLRKELEATQKKLQQQEQQMQQQIQRMHKAMEQQQKSDASKNPSGAIEKATGLASDLGQIYLAVVDIAISTIPLSLRDAVQQQATQAAGAATHQMSKIYVHLEPYVETTKEFYYTYVHPQATAAVTWASSSANSAAAKAGAAANQHLDTALAAVYMHQPHLRPLIPSDLQGRLLLFVLLLVSAYLSGVLLLRCGGMLCCYCCRLRRRNKKTSKKLFAADRAAAATPGNKKEGAPRTFFAGRETAQTPQPVPPRPFDLDRRRKH